MVSDFGYSFSVEETFEKWGHEETLGEVVRMVRALRPDVILTLPPRGPAGASTTRRPGGSPTRRSTPREIPTASGARRARPSAWRPARLFVSGVGGGPAPAEGRTVRVETAVWDSLLGRTYADLGQEARSAHRCQGMGQIRSAVGFPSTLVETRSSAGLSDGSASGEDIFAGIPTGLERLDAFLAGSPEAVERARATLAELGDAVAEARAAFSATAPEDSLPGLRRALDAVRRLREEAAPQSAG